MGPPSQMWTQCHWLLQAADTPHILQDQLVATQKAEQSERPELQDTWCEMLMLWEIAKLQAYDSAGQCSQDQHSVPPETHSANTRVSPPRSTAQHC